jgi:predicted lipid-binding transport protein (Tim44 family)
VSIHSAATGAWVDLQGLAFGVLARAGGGGGGGKSGGGGGGRSSGGRSGGSGFVGGSGGSRGGSGGGFGLSWIFGLVCLLVVIVVVVLIVRAARKSGGMKGVPKAGLPSTPAAAPAGSGTGTTLGHDPAAGRVSSRAAVDAGIARIQERDPGFNEADFLSDCNRAFFTIQQAWSERKPDLSRQVMHDGIWQQHKFQIDQYLSQGRRNMLDNLAVQNTRLVSVSSDDAFDTVLVRFFASCADYDVDVRGDGEPKVVRGDRAVRDWAEDWIFQRKAGAVTKPNGGTMAKRCPNCGAPLDLDLAGICRYCRAPVMSGEFDWVLTRIEQLPSYEHAQQTLPR